MKLRESSVWSWRAALWLCAFSEHCQNQLTGQTVLLSLSESSTLLGWFIWSAVGFSHIHMLSCAPVIHQWFSIEIRLLYNLRMWFIKMFMFALVRRWTCFINMWRIFIYDKSYNVLAQSDSGNYWETDNLFLHNSTYYVCYMTPIFFSSCFVNVVLNLSEWSSLR